MDDTKLSIPSPEEQKRAAYALNMCTVSVSQIIDYNDVNILDQEYDAILNNLNLEEMPKDDALREVLEDLLDVITHFRVSEMEKQFIEKEYQQKMKNAIWSAVPNFGVLLAGGSPLTMAISLANQVGIGYMNYRRNKEGYALDKDRQMFQLKRAAIEQFNYIRKRLFNCAWRLADSYQFPDSYRLTEKQIQQYNLILQDYDIRRKYERLEAVKDSFEAYPPFWYFIGNAANLIANDESLMLNPETRSSFREKAKIYFEKFENIEQNSLLREDVLSSACALEHIDLLLLDENVDLVKVNALLSRAVKMSGNAYDILQLCAITYLKIGNVDPAVNILRMLVNEDYNRIINAQMLSAIYVNSFEKYKADYEILATRINSKYLYPMPTENEDLRMLESQFENKRKDIAKKELVVTIDNYVRLFVVRWNKILSTFESRDYPDDFFYDDEIAKEKRRNEAERVFGNAKLKEAYQKSLISCNYEPSMRQILNDLVEGLFSLKVLSDISLQKEVEESVKQEIQTKRAGISKVQKAIAGRSFQMSDYDFSQTITLNSFISTGLSHLKKHGCSAIDKAGIGEIATIESDLLAFCNKEKIEVPEIAIENENTNGKTFRSKDRFSPEIFGHRAIVDQKNADFIESMVRFVRDRIERITITNNQAEILFRDDPRFNGYFEDSAFINMPDIKLHAVIVIHDKSKKDRDLIFTTDGIIPVHRGKIGYLTPYDEVKLVDDELLLYHSRYNNKEVDKLALANIISDLSKRYRRDLDEYVEYIPGTISMKLLLDWFKKDSRSTAKDVTRVIAIPTTQNLDHLGYTIRNELDTTRCLIQCYYETDSGDVLSMRIVRGEGIDSKVVSLILENDGMLFVGR